MQKVLKFVETSPAAPGTSPSSVALVGSSGAAGVASAEPIDLTQFSSLSVTAALVGATGGPLDIYLQTSFDGGTTWVDYAHFPQLLAGAAPVKYAFTTSMNAQNAAPVVVGNNTTPALAVNTVVGGAWGDRFRLLFVAGAATTVGAAVAVTLSFSRPN